MVTLKLVINLGLVIDGSNLILTLLKWVIGREESMILFSLEVEDNCLEKCNPKGVFIGVSWLQ